MKQGSLFAILFAVLTACAKATIDHDKVQPISQPEPITVAEKAAVKFKPQLCTSIRACVSFPAVNAVDEITGGLKGTNGNDACKYAPLGSQVYGRAGWFKDLWAIMYSWYFPKSFSWMKPNGRHDWMHIVVWIDNPALETPKIVGVSMSRSDSKSDPKYETELKISPTAFAGYQRYHNSGSNTSLRVEYVLDFGSPYMVLSHYDGEYQDLIMWEQLTEGARLALNNGDSFGNAKVPFNDDNFERHLAKAWPL
ncbi:hypothetical protein PHMEG_00028838 [Phytophthora megakarya]|uniref:Necrosis inducing protein NPP1 n=1 Tax=Phytophthora megakarya TaxID=4795 RepID=A0A225V4P0_9STRA|nr:hypothetical protein PHMEG_00028838 [Phytophthora megakarya]